MDKTGYLIIAIVIIVILIAIMVISYIAYRKMPAAKGYEDVHPNAEKCGGCGELECPFYAKYHKEEEK